MEQTQHKNDKVMVFSKFKENLDTINPYSALQNFKDLLDQAAAVGLFKKSEQVIILFRSLDVLHSLITNAEAGMSQEKEIHTSDVTDSREEK